MRDLLEGRINNFLGYGNAYGKIWFVMKEEGFHGDDESLRLRLTKTSKEAIIDIVEGMAGVDDHLKWFRHESPTQSSWRRAIQILMVTESGMEKLPDSVGVQNHQINEFGRSWGNHCMLDFMPLPCLSTRKRDWFYNRFGIEFLATREIYEKHVCRLRADLFKAAIQRYKPKTVVLFSNSLKYKSKWEMIVGETIQVEGNCTYLRKSGVDFFVVPHPGRHGPTSEDWLGIARKIKESVQSRTSDRRINARII